MRFLLLLNRLATICSLCFLAMFILKDVESLSKHQWLIGTVLVLSLCAFVITIVAVAATAIAYLFGKKNSIPKYLFLLNIVFLVVEFYYYLISK